MLIIDVITIAITMYFYAVCGQLKRHGPYNRTLMGGAEFTSLIWLYHPGHGSPHRCSKAWHGIPSETDVGDQIHGQLIGSKEQALGVAGGSDAKAERSRFKSWASRCEDPRSSGSGSTMRLWVRSATHSAAGTAELCPAKTVDLQLGSPAP